MVRTYARCVCECHRLSVVPPAPPATDDPVGALTACSRCRAWHVQPPTVTERRVGDDGAVWPLDYGEGDEA